MEGHFVREKKTVREEAEKKETEKEETGKKEAGKKGQGRRLGLAFKFILGLSIVGVCIMAGMAAAGVSAYWQSITWQYNEIAYQTARTAEGYFTEEQLAGYADAVYRYCTGQTGREEIDRIAESESYLRTKEQLDRLRSAMQANDIFVFVFDIDLLKNFDQEAYDRMEWNPIYYITDSYHIEEEQFSIGDSSAVLKDYVQDCIRAYETGVHADNYFISEGEFGYNTSAMYPVVQDGRTVAFIGVEIPMSTLQGNVRSYLVRTILVGSAITLLLLAAATWFLMRTLVVPVRQVARAAGMFVKNNNAVSDALRGIRTGDEIQLLSESVLQMEEDINSYIENLTRVTAEKERIGAELDVAAHIQADMLPGIFPPYPDRKEIDIYAVMTPAREVGGDFYDFFLVDDDHLALVMADVSGKGVPAALFMVIAKTLIKNRAQMGASPKEVLESVNNQLCENNESEMFVTVWLGIYELSTGRLTAANAGHEYPAVRRNGEGFSLYRDRHGLVLAGMENSRYREYELTLEPGEAVFVYTDGVPEATDACERLFGTDRMLQALNDRPEASAQELLLHVKAKIDRFAGSAPQFDDITMLCLANRNERKDHEGNNARRDH